MVAVVGVWLVTYGVMVVVILVVSNRDHRRHHPSRGQWQDQVVVGDRVCHHHWSPSWLPVGELVIVVGDGCRQAQVQVGGIGMHQDHGDGLTWTGSRRTRASSSDYYIWNNEWCR